MAELEQLVAQTVAAIRAQFERDEFHPGKVSVWIKLIRQAPMEQTFIEETVGSVHKVMLPAGSFSELLGALAENLVVAVYGANSHLRRANELLYSISNLDYKEVPACACCRSHQSRAPGRTPAAAWSPHPDAPGQQGPALPHWGGEVRTARSSRGPLRAKKGRRSGSPCQAAVFSFYG